MWDVKRKDLIMTEGDYGIKLPITVSGVTFDAADSVKFTVKDEMNGTVIVEKTFSDVSENTVDLEFTESESEALVVGSYVYSLDWYQDGNFMCNIIPVGTLKVVDKA